MRALITIQRAFRDVFDDEHMAITTDTRPGDIRGWDSLAHVKIVLAIEAELGFRFNDEEVSPIACVGDLVKAIERHVGA